MKFTRPLRFLPNLRTEDQAATSGYTWGKPASTSNILKSLPISDRSEIDLADQDIVAERWLVTDDRQFPSLVKSKNDVVPFFQLIENHPHELLGEKHVKKFGPYLNVIMKQLDTNDEPSRGSLSVQLHPKLGHPTRPAKPEMWKGWGKAYLGWNQDMNEELIRQSVKEGSLEQCMNQIDLTPDKLVIVGGGMIHALRYGSFVAEWSKAPGQDDIAKGNVKDATVSPFDRTDGKMPRPGKENVEASLEVMKHANTFTHTSTDQLFSQAKDLLSDQDGNTVVALFRTKEVSVDQYHVVTKIELDVAARGIPLYLEQGTMELIVDGKVVDIVRRGEELFLPAALGSVIVHATEQFPAVFQTWYAPFG